MKCPKCNGFMYIERFFDYSLAFYSWKCINCGSIIDQTVLTNKNLKGDLLPAVTPLTLEVGNN